MFYSPQVKWDFISSGKNSGRAETVNKLAIKKYRIEGKSQIKGWQEQSENTQNQKSSPQIFENYFVFHSHSRNNASIQDPNVFPILVTFTTFEIVTNSIVKCNWVFKTSKSWLENKITIKSEWLKSI